RALRAEIERRIDEAAVKGKIPHDLRIRFTLELVDTAVERGDLEHGVMLAGRARKIFDSVQSGTPFPPEFEVGLLGEIALRNAMVGQDPKAGATIDESLGRFEAERRRIADVFQAKSLRPVLEAAIAAGDAERIERLLELTIAAGATNPNARPRAEDLVATMVLLAQVDHEPAEDVFARIQEIRGGLVAPW
ncbi:MAG: hypothetical protein VX672_08985, partial [Planctomycetota bacterium]|nr:hypothetical protein [Planctomycetota bacterium]